MVTKILVVSDLSLGRHSVNPCLEDGNWLSFSGVLLSEQIVGESKLIKLSPKFPPLEDWSCIC